MAESEKMNWVRVGMGGLISALFLTFAVDTGFGFFLTGWWLLRIDNPLVILQNGSVNLLLGLSIVWLYAAIRPRFGPGPRTAAIAAAAAWIIGYGIPILWIPGPETGSWLQIGWPWAHAMSVVGLLAATMVGAWVYQENGDGSNKESPTQT